MHLILTKDGKVLALEEPDPTTQPPPKDTLVFTPTTGDIDVSVPQQVDSDYNAFCSGHAQLSDGRILIVGGGSGADPESRYVLIYDPDQPSQTWNDRALSQQDWLDAEEGRWYATCTTLGNGKILIAGGRVSCDSPAPTDPTNRLLTFDITKAVGQKYSEPEGGTTPYHDFTWYPYMFLRPNGHIFYCGGNDHDNGNCGQPLSTHSFNPNSKNWTSIASSPMYNMSAVMYKPDAFMKVGENKGGEPTTSYCSGSPGKSAWKLDFATLTPAWSAMPCMNVARKNGQLLLSPDGRVMVFGGAPSNTELYRKPEWIDPNDANSTWTLLAAGDTHRAYHSAAILLPDARILQAGSNGQTTAQIFKPPYLFQANGSSADSVRPVIATPSLSGTLIKYDDSFEITLANSGDYDEITQVVLMRLGAATHGFDQEQRRVVLDFSVSDPSSGPLVVETPAHSHLAPPGYYMLFVLKQGDRAGIQFPSVARMVRVGAS
ncbi:MAG: DUF1929 domain-containing protein [Phycisphaerales bacterium]|nr:DUF1929 domain-containing protein [Phycisphaerales bacterium]